MTLLEIESACIFNLQERLAELGWTRDELRAERGVILAEALETHGGPARLDLKRRDERVPLYQQLDRCSAKLFPITEEISAIKREIACRSQEERAAA